MFVGRFGGRRGVSVLGCVVVRLSLGRFVFRVFGLLIGPPFGLGRFVLRGSEHLCLIRPKGDALALETMFLAEDVNSQAEIEEAVGEAEVKAPELDLARQVIDSLVGAFDPKELTSEYRQNLRQMLLLPAIASAM